MLREVLIKEALGTRAHSGDAAVVPIRMKRRRDGRSVAWARECEDHRRRDMVRSGLGTPVHPTHTGRLHVRCSWRFFRQIMHESRLSMTSARAGATEGRDYR